MGTRSRWAIATAAAAVAALAAGVVWAVAAARRQYTRAYPDRAAGDPPGP